MAKKEPGKLNLGTSAVGTGGYMCAELFKAEAGVDVAIIPYKGTAPVMNDLLGGHVPMAFGVLPPALGNIQAGKLRAIAVTSQKRFSLLPDVPTFDESGLPGFEACCTTACWRRPARRRRSSTGSARKCARLVDTDDVQEANPCRRRRSADLDAGRICRRYRQGRKEVGRTGEETRAQGRVGYRV